MGSKAHRYQLGLFAPGQFSHPTRPSKPLKRVWCDYCGGPIDPPEVHSTRQGRPFHVECLRTKESIAQRGEFR